MMDNFAYNDYKYHAFAEDLEIGLGLKKKKKVMVIDDDQDFRLAVCEMLVDEGYLVTTAKDGETGLNYLVHQNDPPDLILLDLMMPVKSGLEFRREQLELDGFSQIPVVFMTGHGHLLGESCLLKPFDEKELMEMIQAKLK
jgi:CheY-like chemotaxis protein